MSTEPPDPPQDCKVVELDGRTATISWSPPYSGNSPIISYLLQHKASIEKWSNMRAIINTTVSGADNTAAIRGLKPVHDYHVRVFAINNLGRSEGSEVLKLRSDEESPGGPPLHIRAVAQSSKSIKISWKAPREDLQFGLIKGYYVGYKVHSSDADSYVYKTLEVNPPPSSGSNSNEEIDCILNSLKRWTKYAVTVQAFNRKGTGPASEVIEVQTLQNDPPPPPVLAISAVTASSIHLTWSMRSQSSSEVTESSGQQHEVPAPPAVSGFILHQRKQQQDSQQASSDWEQLRLPGDRNSHSRDRLACGSKYQFYIVAFNSIGKSDASEIISVKTEGTSPVAPDRNSLIASNTTAATLFLDAWHDGSCPIASFEIFYRPKKSSRKYDSIKVFPDGEKQRQHVIKDLLPSTLYELRIMAVNEAGSTEAQYSFTTASVIRVPATISNDQASVTFPPPIVLDVTLILPATISLVMIVLLIFIAKIWIMRKSSRRQSPTFYGTVYGSCPSCLVACCCARCMILVHEIQLCTKITDIILFLTQDLKVRTSRRQSHKQASQNQCA